MRHAADTAQKTASSRQRMQPTTCDRSSRPAKGREHMRDATSTTTAHHGTDAMHKMQHTTGAAACSKRKRDRQHAAGNAMHGMRDETKGSRTLAHLGALSGSLRGGPWWIVGLRGKPKTV
jgi:hypothetical protein